MGRSKTCDAERGPRSRWNPYLVGAAIGMLSWAVFAIVDKPLGVTTPLSQWCGAVAEPILGFERVRTNAYWAINRPEWDYGSFFLGGIFLGSLAAAWASRDLRIEIVPAVWRERFGRSPSKRLAVAFLGGVLIMYGARMADGCTSGNGISGSLQLAVSGWTFLMTMFLSGLVTAWLMFGRRRTARGRSVRPRKGECMMALPIAGSASFVLAVVFGFLFGMLLERAGLADYNTIVNQFRLKDFTVLRVMLTAIIVGGIGVLVLHQAHCAAYHIKPANMLGVACGAGIFGVGMVLYGYCPGTGIAAVATGSLHGLAGFLGMLAGGILYALSFTWVKSHILSVAALGNLRLPDITGIADRIWFAILAIVAIAAFLAIGRRDRTM